MKPSKRKKIHDWTLDRKPVGMLGFRYKCRRCKVATYNGEPLPMPWKESCQKS